MSNLNLKEARGAFETNQHIRQVQININKLIVEAMGRLLDHDQTKLYSPEVEGFGNAPKLSEIKFDSKEYEESKKMLHEALSHHYSKNRHHPEFHKDGINDMDLIDILEMICDWVAATQRNKDGNIRKSIESNQNRHNISPQLAKILMNTVERYF